MARGKIVIRRTSVSNNSGGTPPHGRTGSGRSIHRTNINNVSQDPTLVFCESYLRLKKRSALTWSTRFLVLRGSELLFFHSKQDATYRRSLIDSVEIASGQIAPRMELGIEFILKDGREFVGRLFSRGDLAKWITAFQRLALKKETHRGASEVSDRSTIDTDTDRESSNSPVVEPTETKRKVSFHGSVLVRVIPSVPEDQVSELFYTKEEVEKFTAQASSFRCRTEDAVNYACLSLRPTLLPWRRTPVERTQVV